jgi:lipopolysaccharide transport system ATP-binding protein
MSHDAIRIDGVSKRFQRGTAAAYLRLTEVLWAGLTGRRSPVSETEEFWALREVSLTVAPGEVVGIVGRNGAGKSTLLKILSRVMRPTEGRVGWRGRMGTLLEVGTGFHPELTGRENIFLNGAILGMSRREVRRRLDEIVAFAEIDRFLETPVKRYSSGMYVRLAFAVAAHLEPEILLVDEVLAVGDYAFQRKCLGKMHDVSRAGRTILFVSHNLTAVTSLCTRAVWLDQGRIAREGTPGEIVAAFLTAGLSRDHVREWDAESAPQTPRVRLRAVRLIPRTSEVGRPIDVRTPLDLEVEFDKCRADGETNVGVYLANIQGVCLFNTVSPQCGGPAGRYRAVVRIPGDLLNNGLHRVRVMLAHDLSPQVDLDGVLMFEVHELERTIAAQGEWAGAVRPRLDWSVVGVEP